MAALPVRSIRTLGAGDGAAARTPNPAAVRLGVRVGGSTESSQLRSVLRLTVRRCATGQACTHDGSYHSADGRPLVNTLRFPDLRRMTARARALGVEPGW